MKDYQISINKGVATAEPRVGGTFSNDPYTVLQRALDSLDQGGSIELSSGVFDFRDEPTINGLSNEQPPTKQIKITGQGYSTKIVQNTKGKNAISVKNGISFFLDDVYIYVGREAKSGILFDVTGDGRHSVWGGGFNNVFVQSDSMTNAAVHLKNFFDLNVPHLQVSSNNNYGIILENASKDVSYGNSNFGFVRSKGSRDKHAGLLLKSSDANSPMNLNTFQNFQSNGSYRGIESQVSARNVFQFVDIEDAFQPIYFDGSKTGGDTRYTEIRSGYILARDKGTAITNTLYTGGNKINCFVEDDQNRMLVSDASQYRPINSYNLQTFGRGSERVDIKSPNIPMRFERVDGSFFDNRNK